MTNQGRGDIRVELIGVTYNPFWPFGREETVISARKLDSPEFEITEFDRRRFDKLIEREKQ